MAGAPGADTPLGPETSLPPPTTDLSPLTPVARRLTKEQYAYTIEDQLGVLLSDEQLAALPNDRPLEGFINIATSQATLPTHVRGFAGLAELVAGELPSDALLAFGDCTENNAACQSAWVAGAGSLLFRRPLTPKEQEDFSALFAALSLESLSFEESARQVLRALLQSPQFLYLLEDETSGDPGAKSIRPLELASRLSYALWNSAPNAALLDAAESGRLGSTAGLGEVVAELLGDTARAERVSRRYLLDWGRLESLPDDAGLRSELIDGVLEFYRRELWEGTGSLLDLFTTQETWLTPTLANNYGLTAGADAQVYDLTPYPGRMGWLTHPGLIAGMTNADGGAIVARGLFMQAQLFCNETPSPPDALQSEIEEFAEAQPETASDRDIAEVRMARAECGGCHGGFDPLAYAFEAFDHVGRFRAEDEHGNALTSNGWIPAQQSSDGVQQDYQNVEEYMQLLSQEPKVQRCLVEQHLGYALGARLTAEQAPVVEELWDGWALAGSTYTDLMGRIVQHPLFRTLEVQ